MSRQVKVVIGAGYGDEGKGRLTDYFSNKNTVVIRFNGGAQAGHTATAVRYNGKPGEKGYRDDLAPFYTSRHVFHHFGSGTFQGASTYLSEYFIVNPVLYFKELEELEILGVDPEVYINENCMVTTPYDMMLNEIIERSRGNERHGSCGCGINETVARDAVIPLRLNEPDIEARLKRIKNEYVNARLDVHQIRLTTDYDDIIKALNNEKILVRYMDEFNTLRKKMVGIEKMKTLLEKKDIVFEGAQGLMLDQGHRFFPHVTRSNTGIKNVTDLLVNLEITEEPEIVYVTRCYATRHGRGPFPGEVKNIRGFPIDQTNVVNSFQGALRYGNLNLDVLREAITNDLIYAPLQYKKSLAVTCLDQMDNVTFIISNLTRKMPKNIFTYVLARHLGFSQVYMAEGPTKAHTLPLTIDIDRKPWFLTESLCELCGMRQTGCEFQYDGEECQEKRFHFLNNPL